MFQLRLRVLLHEVSHPEYRNKVKKHALENQLAEILQTRKRLCQS